MPHEGRVPGQAPVPAQVGITTQKSFLDSRQGTGVFRTSRWQVPMKAVLRGHEVPDTSDSPHRRAEPLQEPPGGLPKSPCAGPEARLVRGTARWSERPEGTLWPTLSIHPHQPRSRVLRGALARAESSEHALFFTLRTRGRGQQVERLSLQSPVKYVFKVL